MISALDELPVVSTDWLARYSLQEVDHMQDHSAVDNAAAFQLLL